VSTVLFKNEINNKIEIFFKILLINRIEKLLKNYSDKSKSINKVEQICLAKDSQGKRKSSISQVRFLLIMLNYSKK